MAEYNLILGDCLDKLKELPDNSVDSIVTDPPYGLGDNLYKRVNKTVWKSFNIMLPNFHEGDIKRIQYRDFSFKSGLCPDLGRCETIPVIKSRVTMPESPVHFDSNIEIGEIEINRSTVSSSFAIPDTMLMNKFDTNGSKFIGNFIFDFGNSIDFTADDVFSGNFGQFSYGFFSVPISSIFSSCFPNSGTDFPFPIFRDGVFDIVWGSNYMGDDSFSHSFALTENRAEDVSVLTFDLTRASDYSSATITTFKSDTFSTFIRPKIVRTNLTASSLSTMLQPVRVSFILETTNGTSSEYFLHLYIPKGLLNSIANIYTNSSGFMGKKWDYDVPTSEIWEECLRVLKPGGHLLAFAGTRTQHRMAVAIEDGGFEIRDMIAWVYGSGFPKSQNISKAIDKAAGAIREVVGKNPNYHSEGKRSATGENHYGKNDGSFSNPSDASVITAPATDEAKYWDGWGTALKPALEPITVARKPLEEKTVAANVLKYGTGGINIDESRIPANGEKTGSNGAVGLSPKNGWNKHNMPNSVNREQSTTQGRFPANFIHDGSDEVTELFPYSKSTGGKTKSSFGDTYGTFSGESLGDNAGGLGDEGSAARFFYCAKTSKKDRNEGLDDFEEKSVGAKGNGIRRYCSQCGVSILESHLCKCEVKDWVNPATKKNNHPTVKPTDLMRYLVRMVTPKGGTVLDPFMGSGSTGKAAMLEGFNFIGIELDPDYIEIAKARIEYAKENPTEEKVVDKKAKTVYSDTNDGLDRFFE